MTPADLCAHLQHSTSSLFECQARPQGDVRVRTPFLLPDRDVVDLFVKIDNRDLHVSDYGLALSWLRTHSATGKLSPPTREHIEDLMQTLDVRLYRGQIEIRGATAAEVGFAIHKVGQAVVRVAELFRTMRTHTVRSVADDVEDWLRQREFGVTRRSKVFGRTASWTIDFEIRAAHRTSLVYLLSSGSRAGARDVRNRVYTGFSDIRLGSSKPPEDTLVSLIDDISDVWSDEDFALLRQVSRVAIWSMPDEIESILTTPADSPALRVATQEPLTL